jgi:predicted dehydrogenase
MRQYTNGKGDRPFNVAIIGCGRIGEREASAVVTIPELRLVAVSDIGPAFRDKALRMGRTYECDVVHDWQHLVTRPDVDIVVVSTPNSFHKDISIEAMRHGKHVLCEKPLAITPEEAEPMVLTAQAQGVLLMTNFNHRLHDHNWRAKHLVDQGRIGRPVFIRGRIGHGRFITGPSPAEPGRFQCQDTWYMDIAQAGGGTVIDNGVHLFDLARWFMGDEFVDVQGSVTRNLDRYDPQHNGSQSALSRIECEDNGFGLFRTADGRIAALHSSWVQWQGYLHLEIFGTHGSVIINNDQLQGHVSYYGFDDYGAPLAQTIEFPPLLKPDPSWKRQLQEFVAALQQQREPSPNGYDGLQALRMVQALYKSAASEKTAPIETTWPSMPMELNGVAALHAGLAAPPVVQEP